MSFSVMTCRPGRMAAIATGACRCSGRAIITASMLVVLGVGDQFLVVAIDLDFLAGRRLVVPVVDGHQPGAGLQAASL